MAASCQVLLPPATLPARSMPHQPVMKGWLFRVPIAISVFWWWDPSVNWVRLWKSARVLPLGIALVKPLVQKSCRSASGAWVKPLPRRPQFFT